MPPKDVAEVVIKLINLVFARLGPVLAEAEREEARYHHYGKPCTGSILWGNRESSRRREDRSYWLDGHKIKSCITCAQLVEDVRIKNVVPRRRKLLGMPLRLFGEPWHRGSRKRERILRRIGLDKPVRLDGIFRAEGMIHLPNILVGFTGRDGVGRV